jgi:predicted XRE-type DNA-binding protein
MKTESKLRKQIGKELARAINNTNLTTREAAAITGIRQSQLIRFARGTPGLVSLDLIMQAISRLGYDIHVTIKQGTGGISLVMEDKIEIPEP